MLSLVLATMIGCQTDSKVTAAKTILATQMAVDNAMDGYADLVALQTVSIDDRIKVRNLYLKYEKAEETAVAGLTLGDLAETLTPEEMADLAFELTILILSFSN